MLIGSSSSKRLELVTIRDYAAIAYTQIPRILLPSTRETEMHTNLKALDQAERKAWRVKMNGSEADASTVYGQEGKNELAWRAAADACRTYREAHGLIGKRGY